MSEAPNSTGLLGRVQRRLQVVSFARSLYLTSATVLVLSVVAVLAIRLLGLLPPSQQQPLYLLSIPAISTLLAVLFCRRVEQQAAARLVDAHANTKDLFLTLSSLASSAGEYQPLVISAAEKRAEKIVPDDVVPFKAGRRIFRIAVLLCLLLIAVRFTPQLDPLGRVEAATKGETQQKLIESIRQDAMTRADKLKKEAERAAEEAEEIDTEISQLKTDFRKMQPNKMESNARVLDIHRKDLGDMWKAAASDEQLRRMINQPISQQQLGGTRSEKMNEWLKDLQEGKTESLQNELKKARETMQAMMEAKDPEERKKLASKLQKELQDLEKFAKDKAGSKELASALSKAMKSLEVCKNPAGENENKELTKDALEALKESLQLSEKELEQVAQAAKDLQKLEDAMKTLQQAQQLNQKEKLDGAKCEGCESLEDYAELYAQMMGDGAAEGDKDRNEGGKGIGRGGESPEDDSDPEGYKKEKEKPQIQAGKMLLSIKSKEYAEEKDFDPEKMREYEKNVSALKTGVQSAIDAEEIPPGYVEGIKGYFDKIDKVDSSPARAAP